MDKTKEAIRGFMHKAGHHDTTVHQEVEPAVQHETVKPTRHDDVNTAVDKEIHQDHYHRTVQPVHDREVLPEQHHHNVGAVEHRDFDHRDHENTKRALQTEAQKFKNERVVHDTTHTQGHAPVIQGEHVHHHIHETVQPVIHKETIQPSVVHTTVPIHETHHNSAKHHETTTLPAVNIADYKKSGGILGGHKEQFHHLQGEPSSIKEALTATHHKGTHETAPREGTFHGDFNPLDGAKKNRASSSSSSSSAASRDGTSTTKGHTGQSAPVTNRDPRSTGTGLGHHQTAQAPVGTGHTTGTASGTTSGVQETRKPSLLNRLNPMTDSNGDGKAGFMK